MARNAIVVSIAGVLDDSEIVAFKDQMRKAMDIPDQQELYIVACPYQVGISSVVIQEDRE